MRSLATSRTDASLLVAACLVVAGVRAGEGTARAQLPESAIRYEIDVRLDVAEHALDGAETIRWTNTSDAVVDRIPIHLYLNAFSHEGTTFLRGGALRDTDTDDIARVYPDPWGAQELLTVEQQIEGEARVVPWRYIRPDDENPLDRTLAELLLPFPAPPGRVVVLRITFHARLPAIIERTGGRDGYYFVAQWFPKIGAFEPRGVRSSQAAHFAARQFHGATEFYADFADWIVTITAPSAYLVAATGVGSRARAAAPDETRHRFEQRAVHDFAWVAGRRLVDVEVARAPARPAGASSSATAASPVTFHYVVPRGTEHQVARWRTITETTFDFLGRTVGAWPYDSFTLVMPDATGLRSSGMEYPTLVTGIPGDPLLDLAVLARLRVGDGVIAHEITHNWFYGMLASNEQEEAFLDEGFTQYWEGRVLRAAEAGGAPPASLFGRILRPSDEAPWALSRSFDAIREPARKRPAGMFHPGSEGRQVYSRPAAILETAERLFGVAAIDRVFAGYFTRHRFRHPEWSDFLATARDLGGAAMAAFLDEAFTRDRLPDYRVAELSTAPWDAPLGLVPTSVDALDLSHAGAGDGDPGAAAAVIVITPENRDDHPEAGLDPGARESDGRVLVEISDGGYVHAEDRRDGAVTRRYDRPEAIDPLLAATFTPDERFHESTVRVEGPSWDHLPTTVELRFEDGVILRDAWDGKSEWRAYRFVRRAPLREVRVDPEQRLLIDPNPENNARAINSDRWFVAGWAVYLGAAAQWIVAGIGLWL